MFGTLPLHVQMMPLETSSGCFSSNTSHPPVSCPRCLSGRGPSAKHLGLQPLHCQTPMRKEGFENARPSCRHVACMAWQPVRCRVPDSSHNNTSCACLEVYRNIAGIVATHAECSCTVHPYQAVSVKEMSATVCIMECCIHIKCVSQCFKITHIF